jgi:hypothetical protein
MSISAQARSNVARIGDDVRTATAASAESTAQAQAPAPAAPAGPETQAQLAVLVEHVLRLNCWLNWALRAGLALFGLAAGMLALLYTARHADAIATAVDADGDVATALLAATLPILLFVLLGALAGAVAWALHSRGIDETYSTLDTIGRMQREGEVAVSARGLIFAFEEKLQNARRAFTLLLWLGRTLFLVCLGLFVAAVVNAIAGGAGLVTVVLGGSSVAGALLGVVKAVPRNIAHNLADVIQIQSIITGCDRQISLLESAALHAINCDAGAAGTRDTVLDAQRRMDQVVASAVRRIERYSDTGAGERA